MGRTKAHYTHNQQGERTMRQRPSRIIALALGLLGLFGCAGERPDNLGAQDALLVPCPR